MDDTKVGSDKKDDPADVARQGFEALMARRAEIGAGSPKTKIQAAVIRRLPETLGEAIEGDVHRSMAEPGSAK